MASEVGADSTVRDWASEGAVWALETGFWDGRHIALEETTQLLKDLEQKVYQKLFAYRADSPFFEQTVVQLA